MSGPFRIVSRIRGPALFGRPGERAHILLREDQPLILEREPANPADSSAVIVRTLLGEPVGYVQRPHSFQVASLIDSGRMLLAKVVRRSRETRPGYRSYARALIWDDGPLLEVEKRVAEPVDG